MTLNRLALRRRRRAAHAAGVSAALAAILLFTACTSEAAAPAAPVTTTPAPSTADEASIGPAVPSERPDTAAAEPFHPEVGQCLDARKDRPSGPDSIVPCDEPHDDEVYATFTLDHGEYPGEAAAETLANDGCRARFADFIGIADEDSVFEFFPMYPSPEGWNAHGDRTVRCIVWYPADTVVGSLSGAGY